MFAGLTPLHVAVLSHNAVLQELSRGPPCAQSPVLLQKRKLLAECVNTLLLMGASLEAKVCNGFTGCNGTCIGFNRDCNGAVSLLVTGHLLLLGC